MVARRAVSARITSYAEWGLHEPDGSAIADNSLVRELIMTLMSCHLPPAERRRATEGHQHAAKIRALVEKMADHFAKPGTGYPALPWPAYGPHFNDYAHLERVAEWSTAGGGEE